MSIFEDVLATHTDENSRARGLGPALSVWHDVRIPCRIPALELTWAKLYDLSQSPISTGFV